MALSVHISLEYNDLQTGSVVNREASSTANIATDGQRRQHRRVVNRDSVVNRDAVNRARER